MKVEQLLQIVKLMEGNKPEASQETNHGIRIVVLQRGWVCVGRYFRKGTECRLENASVIRRWGTSNGLPELAAKGPLAETKLEKSVGDIRFHRSAEVLTLDCGAAWEK